MSWNKVISLEQAAKNFSSVRADDSKIKTKVRRLYDIANVLVSLRLIEKCSLPETRKPAFKWIGEKGFELFVSEMHYEIQNRLERQPSIASTASNETTSPRVSTVWAEL